MGAHNVNDDTPAKLGEVVGSYDGVFIPRQNIVQSCLVFHEIINTRPVFQGPFHMGNQTSQRETLLFAAFKNLLDQSKHPLLIEMAVPQVRISPVAQLKLSALFCPSHIDAGQPQALEVLLTQLWIDNVKCFLTALESLFDKWQQHPILLIRAVKERADVTVRTKR